MTRTDTCNRIAIVGGPGTGKTTLARELSLRLELNAWDLDLIAFEQPEMTLRPLAERLADVHFIASQPKWVVAGIFLGWTDELLEKADVIVWLDHLPPGRSLSRISIRFVEGGVLELKRQKGARKFTRFRDYRRQLRGLASGILSSWSYHQSDISSDLDNHVMVTRATMALHLSKYVSKLIHCTREEDVLGIESGFPVDKDKEKDDQVLVSIIVNNHNYGRFIRNAILSALGQTYSNVEVIVVDDGSTDDSREVIHDFRDQVSTVFKNREGQASAFNAGFKASHGSIVIFLDSDDVLLPSTVQHVVDAFAADSFAAKVQYRMEVINEAGVITGQIKPASHLPFVSGDLRRQILAFPDDVTRMATSGNAFSRSALERLLPVPQESYGSVGADWYLTLLAPLLGNTVSVDLVGAYYRVHGGNSYERTRLDLDQVRRSISYMSTTRRYISRLQQQGKVSFLDNAARVDDSVTFIGHRLISMKLEPGLHPVQADTLSGLYFSGLAATHRRFDVGLPMKVLYNLWFSLMVVAPRPAAKWLTHRFLFTDSRGYFNRLLRVLQRKPKPKSVNQQFVDSRLSRHSAIDSFPKVHELGHILYQRLCYRILVAPPIPKLPALLGNDEDRRARVFARIYRSKLWAEATSVSGPGSELERTAAVRNGLPDLLEDLQVRTFLDAPCGDFGWMSTVSLPPSVERYVGIDIVPEIVAELNLRYGDERHLFLHRDLCADHLPQADFVLCRDCLVHLSYSDIDLALKSIWATGVKYILTTTFPAHTDNHDILTGDWRPLNLEARPFCWPPPLKLIEDAAGEVGGEYGDKSLGLWRAADIRSSEP